MVGEKPAGRCAYRRGKTRTRIKLHDSRESIAAVWSGSLAAGGESSPAEEKCLARNARDSYQRPDG